LWWAGSWSSIIEGAAAWPNEAGTGSKLTIVNVAVLDLLQHFRPYFGMARLILSHVLGLEPHNLPKTAAGIPLAHRLCSWRWWG
jgi:hypothetical protein